MLSCVLLVQMMFIVASAAPRYSSRIVNTQAGAVRGIIRELNSPHLEPTEAFLGVPYAAPPVGDLRLAAAREPLRWSGTKLADTLPPVCPQRPPDLSNVTAVLQTMPRGRLAFLNRLVPYLTNQSEDCLNLNIYVPGSGSRGMEAPYAVIVFFHGESYSWGSGNPYDGSALASYSHVIFVAVNYRLGILGFLKTHSKGKAESGNFAVSDLIASLRWIKSNIAAFGGDPGRVTIMGHDTGAALATILALMPSAKGLFHRVIAMSGSMLSPWAVVHDPNGARASIAAELGCALASDLAPCLRTHTLASLLAVRLVAPRFLSAFGPALPAEPLRMVESAPEHFITTQLMIGVATTESYHDFNANDVQYGFEEDQRNRILRTFVRNAFTFHLNEIFSTVRNEYTDWDKPILHPINIRDSTMEALSDGHTVAPCLKFGFLHSRRGAKTYLFHFNYQSKDSDYPQRLGTVRGEDLPYVLGVPFIAQSDLFPFNYTRQDIGVAEAVMNFISNFAKTGDPNEPRASGADFGAPKERSRYKSLTWDQYDINTQQYLSIAAKPKMKSHYRGHKMAVWLNLIPQLHQPGDDDVSMRHHHFHERANYFYAGAVKPETMTRSPVMEVPTAPGSILVECPPNVTSLLEEDGPDDVIDNQLDLKDSSTGGGIGQQEDEENLLRKLTSRHYSYTTALGITVGVGCLLLLLNLVIFAGIYYQRKRRKRRRDCSSESFNSIALTVSSKMTSYMSEPKSPTIPEPPPPPKQLPPTKSALAPISIPVPTPCPPVRTCSSLSVAPGPGPAQGPGPPPTVVKKRVQIQEISV